MLVAKLLLKGIVRPSILSKPGTMGKDNYVSDRDCRILALSASAAMASREGCGAGVSGWEEWGA